MYHAQLSEFPTCHTGPFLSFAFYLFLYRNKTDGPRWIAKPRESESAMTLLLVKLMCSGRACTLLELLATRRVLDESVMAGSELTVVFSIRACCSLPHDEYLVSRWWQIASLHRRLRVCVGLHNPLLLQPPNSSCRQHTVQYSDGFEKDGSQSTQFQELASFCFEKNSELRRFPSSLVFPKELDVEQNSLYLFHQFLLAYLAVFTTLANQALSSTSTSCPLSLPSPAHTFSDMLILPSCRGGEMVNHAAHAQNQVFCLLCDQVKLQVVAKGHKCCVHTCDISMSRNTENNIFGRRQHFEFLMFPTGLSKTKFQIGSHDPIFWMAERSTGNKRFSQNERRRIDLQKVASDFFNFCLGT